MKLMPDTALIQPPIAGAEGGKGAKPRLGAHTSSGTDFLSQLRDRSGAGDQTARRSSRDQRPSIAADSTLAVALSGSLAPHRSNDVGRAATDSDRAAVEANSVRPSKTTDATRAAPVVGDGRGSSESIHVASVDWPWLAIATGGLSYRPTFSAAASTEISQASASAALRWAVMRADASVATQALESVEGKAVQGTSVNTMLSLGATPMASPAGGSSEAREVDTTAWPLPAELRELLERRRLRLVEDANGGLHLFARDFAMDEAQADHWAAALREACHTMKQPLRALWINGRAYEVQQGERHDR